MKTLVIYSSVTGNTGTLARAIATALPGHVDLHSVYRAPPAAGYELLLLGFWVYRRKPDPRALRYMKELQGQNVAVFGTLAAWPHSEHARAVLAHARHALSGNRYLGEFLCLGKLSRKRFLRAMDPACRDYRHPRTPERIRRLQEGQKHPDAADLARAAEYFYRLASNFYQEKNNDT